MAASRIPQPDNLPVVGHSEINVRCHLDEKSLALIGNASVKVVPSGWKSWAEAFSIRRLGGSRWRGGRGPMGFECLPGGGSRGRRAPWKCESLLVTLGGAANGWNGRLEKG